tara:strand:+ start:2856 stop:3263 length:408 start_codon:yes stop_codon:yes gene_type:complete
MERALSRAAEILHSIKYRGGTMKNTFTDIDVLNKSSLETDQLLWIYAEWCGPCQRSQTAWKEAKEFVIQKNYPVKIQSIDGSKYPQVPTALKTKGFPTFLVISKRANSGDKLRCEETDCRNKEMFINQLKKRYSY